MRILQYCKFAIMIIQYCKFKNGEFTVQQICKYTVKFQLVILKYFEIAIRKFIVQ